MDLYSGTGKQQTQQCGPIQKVHSVCVPSVQVRTGVGPLAKEPAFFKCHFHRWMWSSWWQIVQAPMCSYHRGLHYSLNYKLFGGAVPRPFCGRICVCVWHGILEQWRSRSEYCVQLVCFVAIRFIDVCGWSGTKTGDPYIGSTRFCSFS